MLLNRYIEWLRIGIIIFWMVAAGSAIILMQDIPEHWREMFAYSFIIPILMASFRYGQLGGLSIALVCSLISGSMAVGEPEVLKSPVVQRVLFQILFFNGVALVTSWLSEQEKLAKSRYRGLYEGVPVGLYRTDPGGRILDVNPAMMQILGYSDRSELMRKISGDLYANKEERENWFARMLREGTVHDFELQARRYDNSVIWLKNTSRSVRDAAGNLLYFEGSIEDISVKKQAQELLARTNEELERRVKERTEQLQIANESLKREIEDRQRAEQAHLQARMEWERTFYAVSDLILVIDDNFRITRANQALATKLGMTPGQLEGQFSYRCLFGAEYPPEFCPYQKARQDGEPHTYEGYIERLGGHFSWTAFPFRDAQGRQAGGVMVGSDISERIRIEEERLRKSKLESLGILAGGIAHDFNNLLTGIVGNLSLARSMLERGGDARPFLQEAECTCKRASDLTAKFITFSDGGWPVQEVTCIRELVENALGLCLSSSTIQYHSRIPSDLPNVLVDRQQIGHAIYNILTNAAEASPQGSEIQIMAQERKLEEKGLTGAPLKPGTYIKLDIIDHGSGIPAQHLDKIFDPYFSTKELGSQKGMGLGLSTAYSIVSRHNGHITVDSAEGSGSTFSIYLPAVT